MDIPGYIALPPERSNPYIVVQRQQRQPIIKPKFGQCIVCAVNGWHTSTLLIVVLVMDAR